jgi:hypothetical protein
LAGSTPSLMSVGSTTVSTWAHTENGKISTEIAIEDNLYLNMEVS